MLKPTTFHVLLAAMLLTAAAAAFGQDAQPSAKAREAQLIAVLKSDAPHKEKADACRALARIGTRASVAPLAAMLGDEKLSHMARYGLETIADPAVDVALRGALGQLKGLPLVGVIGSIGVRRDAKAVAALAALLKDDDAETAQAAARALGKIGTPAAAKALAAALADVPQANQVAFCEGLFRSAEALAAAGERDEALAVYDRLRGLKKAPQQVRAGALRGAVLTRGREGLPLLLEAVRGDDFVLVAAAARTAMEMPGPDVTQALAGELDKLPADKKILIIQTLGHRAEAGALPALVAAARSGEKPVRMAAIRAFPAIGDAAAVPVLVALLGDADGEIAKAAQENLAALPGPKADAAVTSMLKEPDAGTRRLAAELLGQRRVAGAVAPLLAAAAEDADEEVRAACIKVLGDLAGAAELPAMLGILMKAKSSPEMQAAESSLSAICSRQARPAVGNVVIRQAVYGDLPAGASIDVTKKVAGIVKAGSLSVDASNSTFGDPAQGAVKKLRVDYTVDGTAHSQTVNEGEALTITAAAPSPACTDALCAALAQAPTQPKLALLRVLRVVGGAKALGAIRAAAGDSNAEVKDTALRALCEWPSVDALPDLARLARTASDTKIKVLALRGWMRLIPQQDAPRAQQLASLKEAMALAERDAEKKVALAALGSIPMVESLALVMPHVGSPGLKEEACMAAVGIAEKIVGRHPAQVAEAMNQVIKATADKRVIQRARKVLQQVPKAAPRK